MKYRVVLETPEVVLEPGQSVEFRATARLEEVGPTPPPPPPPPPPPDPPPGPVVIDTYHPKDGAELTAVLESLKTQPKGHRAQVVLNRAIYEGAFQIAADGVSLCSEDTGFNVAKAESTSSPWRDAPTLQQMGTKPVLTIANGTRGVQVKGLQFIGHQSAVSIVNVGMPTAAVKDLADDVLIDSCCVLGVKGMNRRGITLGCAGAKVTGCHIGGDILGKNAESQAVASWNGKGPYTILHSFLSAAGECFLIGGSASQLQGITESDIEIGHCILWKNPAWMGIRDISFQKKNLGELKRGINVHIHHNQFLNSLNGSQNGNGVLFTVRCEHGKNPWQVIRNVLFEENYLHHAAGCINTLGRDYNSANMPGACENITIRNNKFDTTENWSGQARGIMLLGGTKDVAITNNTFTVRNYMVILDTGPTNMKPTDPNFVPEYPIENLTIRDNRTGQGILGRGTAGEQALKVFCRGNVDVANNSPSAPGKTTPDGWPAL